MPIPDELREAIREYKRLNAHGALRRQLQYIGKLMRSVDAEPIEARLAVLRGESDQHTGWLHRLERWRDRLLAEDKALDALLAEYPGLDIANPAHPYPQRPPRTGRQQAAQILPGDFQDAQRHHPRAGPPCRRAGRSDG